MSWYFCFVKTEKLMVRWNNTLALGHVSILLIMSFPYSDVQHTVRNRALVIEEKVKMKAADLEENIIYSMGMDLLFRGKVNKERKNEVLVQSQWKLLNVRDRLHCVLSYTIWRMSTYVMSSAFEEILI